MKLLLAEYTVVTGMTGDIRKEGQAIHDTLKASFERAGCEVFVPYDFEDDLPRLARSCDCGLVVAPDDLLEEYTAALEKECINLGCPSRAVRLCADKTETTELLLHNGIPAPRLVHEPGVRCVVKPRSGCASEGVYLSDGPVDGDDIISTEYIEGEHLSVTLVRGGTTLPLTLNRQHIHFNGAVHYDGNEVPYEHPAKAEIFEVACAAGDMLGCKGLFGIDIVYGDKPYVVDVNPRATTAILGVSKVMEENVADLILRAKFGTLPENVHISGHYSFTKKDLEALR